MTTKDMVKKDATRLHIYNLDNIKGNIQLPTVGEHGSEIAWESSHPTIIKGSKEAKENIKSLGWVKRPEQDTKVTLTASLSKGKDRQTKTFNLLVKKSIEEPIYAAYFFSYFTGEYEGGEEISFATAKDPLKWRALNNGKSIIQSTMGEKGLRDPFIMRSPEGDKFYLLATDLKMGESTNFDQAQITGSRSLMIWESDDLVNWSNQRMVEVAPKKGGNTWAPEAFYDEKTGDYVVFWASSMKTEDTYGKYTKGRPSGQYNVIYYATTRDFYKFSEPAVYIDEGFPTIDTTMIKNKDILYRFTKSEVNMKVYYEKADHIFRDQDDIKENGYQFEPISGTKDGNKGTIGHAGNNEGQTVFKDIHQDKWYLFLDSWPYHVRTSTDLEDGSQFRDNLLEDSDYVLPPGPRHGTVMPITQEEYDALQRKYAVEGPDACKKPVSHYKNDENRHVEMPNNLIQTLNLEKMTIALWVKVNKDILKQKIFEFSSPTGRIKNRNTMYLTTEGDTGELEFAIITPFSEIFEDESTPLGKKYKYALRGPELKKNKWHHLAIRVDNFHASLYVDGQEVAKSSTFNIEPRMLLETSINRGGFFEGQLNDFRIYNRALTKKELLVLAKPPLSDVDTLKKDMEDLKVYNIGDVRGNLTLPTKTNNNSRINWVSEDESIITSTGEVTRPVNGHGDVKIKLTAHLTCNDVTDTKEFIATVKEMPKKEQPYGYLFSYFTGESYPDGEQIYFALSQGNDPLQWDEMNDGKPALVSKLGEKGLRDPFIIRSPEGDKFYLIATDLKIHGDFNWSRAGKEGSLSMMVWESSDLLNWSKQRMVEISPELAGNTWAPEVIYDKTTGEYVVFWASQIYEDLSKQGNPYQRMMYAKTRDFYTFTEAKEYFNPGYSVIDTTMIEQDGKIYSVTKDERDVDPTISPNGKHVFQQVRETVLDPNPVMIKEGVGKESIEVGEGPILFKANGEEKWYLFIDEFGNRGYVPFETTDLASGNWTMAKDYKLPARPRHGSIIPLTISEYEKLRVNL